MFNMTGFIYLFIYFLLPLKLLFLKLILQSAEHFNYHYSFLWGFRSYRKKCFRHKKGSQIRGNENANCRYRSTVQLYDRPSSQIEMSLNELREII